MDTAASHALSALSDAAAAASPAEQHDHDASHHAPTDSTAGVPGIVKSEGGQAAMKGDEASKDSMMDTSTSTSSRSPRPQQPATPASTVASAPALPAAAGTARSELVNGPSHEKHSSEQQAVYNNSMHSAHASNSVASGSIPLKAASLSHPAPNGSPASSSSFSASQGSPGNSTASSSGILAGGNNTLKRESSSLDL